MDKSILSLTAGLSPALGFATMIGLGLFLLILSFGSRLPWCATPMTSS